MVDDASAKLAPAVKLLQVYGKEGDRALLRDFYYQDDRWLDGALLSIEEAGETDVRPVLNPPIPLSLTNLPRNRKSALRCGRTLSRTLLRTKKELSNTR